MITIGRAALGLLALLVLGAIGAVLSRANWPISLNASDWAAIRFTLTQSLVSAAVSVALAIPLARALARRAFFGRGFLLIALGAPFILPVIVAVFGLLAIWGRSGLFSDGLMALGWGRLDIYGFHGVVLAHVFFNLPLATRFVLQGWASLPAEHFRLAAQLGFRPRDMFTRLEWPMLREVVPGAFVLIFILCTTSFATVLALGGGPKATSVELAIYSAIRFDFDLGRAAMLAIVQLVLTGGAALALLALGRPVDLGQGLARARNMYSHKGRWLDALVITLAACFLFLPMSAVIWRGISGLASLHWSDLLPAIAMSMQVAFLSTIIAVLAGVGIAALAARTRHSWIVEVTATTVLILSPFVLGTGLFILINPIADPFALSLPLTALVNGALSIPFCVRILVPAFQRVERNHGRLSQSLGIVGRDRLKLVIWPAIRAPLGFAAGIAAAFSLGDLGVIALFAPVDGATLPLLMYRLMGSYQMEAAAAAALILVGLSFGAFALLDWGGRRGRHL